MEQYIAFLLGRFFPDENSVDFPACHDRVTTSYQEDELNLRRLNFRIAPELWLILKMLARAAGLSICHLFTVLLKMDIEAQSSFDGGNVFSKAVEVPTVISVPVKKNFWYNSQGITFIERLNWWEGESRRWIIENIIEIPPGIS